MRCSWGGTRFVVLIGPLAIKFARIRPFRAICQLVRHSTRKGEVARRLRKWSKSPMMGVIRYLSMGIISNHQESCLWRECRRDYMVPTIFSLAGLINVQWRGSRLSQEELDREHPFAHELVGLDAETIHDLIKVENFCRLRGKVCLADYGSDETFLYLYRNEQPLTALA